MQFWIDLAIVAASCLLGFWFGRRYQLASIALTRVRRQQQYAESESPGYVGAAHLHAATPLDRESIRMEPDTDLEDAEELHRKHPDTFAIPPLDARETLDVGTVVKICLHPAGDVGCRFYVEVCARFDVDGGGVIYTGVATRWYDNDIPEGRAFGFEPRHVYEIYALHDDQIGRN